MSDNRKILIAKRKNERISTCERRSDSDSFRQNINSTFLNQGVKRYLPASTSTPKKNLANERLKRLRTSLNEEVKNSLNKSNAAFQAASAAFVNKITEVRSPKKRSQENIESVALPKTPKIQAKTIKPISSFSFADFANRSFVSENPSNVSSTNTSSDFMEQMDWNTCDDRVQPENLASHATDLNVSLPNSSGSNEKGDLYIIVDTNIFIHQLRTIKSIITMDLEGGKNVIIFIPWMVIEELDYIKDDTNKSELKRKAQEAIKYVNNMFKEKNERIRGQTLEEANTQKDYGKSADNKIIACSIQLMRTHPNVLLFTNDINLQNKARINNVPTCTETELLNRISIKNIIELTKKDKILNKMTSLCAVVIRECASIAYGKACRRMDTFRTNPKSLPECIRIFKKYWFPVFQELLVKQFKKAVDDLSLFLLQHRIISDHSNELGELVRLCVRVCLFLKDVNSCRNKIENTITELNNIKEL